MHKCLQLGGRPHSCQGTTATARSQFRLILLSQYVAFCHKVEVLKFEWQFLTHCSLSAVAGKVGRSSRASGNRDPKEKHEAEICSAAVSATLLLKFGPSSPVIRPQNMFIEALCLCLLIAATAAVGVIKEVHMHSTVE